MSVVIREEASLDAATIHAVTASAFLNAPHTSHTEHVIVDALRRAGALTLSLVADEGGEVVGHVAVSPVSIADGTTGWFGIGPISVRPDLQGRGIGSLLMRDALRRLRERGAAGCVLLGNPAYYARFGFMPEPSLVLPGVPPEYFQALRFDGPWPRGVVTYHAAFEAGR